MPIDFGACGRSNHGPPVMRVTVAPPRSAMRPAAATSQADSPPCWMNASNRPLATYARASAAEPIERGMRIALRTFRARVAAARPLSDIEMTKSDSCSLSEAVTAWLPAERPTAGRPVDRRRERLVAGRVEDDADGRRAVDDEADRDAEERDAVGVVHGAVERVDDPDPAATGGRRLAGDRAVLPGLLGQDRVARVAWPGWRRG